MRRALGPALAAAAAAFAAAATLAAPAAAQTRLLMFEQPGCAWCARWHEEVGDAYARTEEGRRAPLQRLQLRGPLPEGLEISPRPALTPVFVLVHDGEEVGRIRGYAGEDFFWPMLGALLDRLPEAAEPPS